MVGAQKLKADTTQKMKTIKLTEEEKQEREKARYEIWETNIRKQRRAKETTKEMGLGKLKLRGRVEKKREWKEQITEKQQEEMYSKKGSIRTLTGNRKEIKKTISQRIPFQQRFLLTWPKVMPCWFVLGFLRQRIALGHNHRTKQEHGAKKDVNSPFPGRVDGGHRVINQSLKS